MYISSTYSSLYGQYSEVQPGKTAPAPGSFELSKGILRSAQAMRLGFEPLTLNFRDSNLRELTIRPIHKLRIWILRALTQSDS